MQCMLSQETSSESLVALLGNCKSIFNLKEIFQKVNFFSNFKIRKHNKQNFLSALEHAAFFDWKFSSHELERQ